ncbi:unnamed protein product [Periconia digitata]|uniref:Uncharacterized protein n=1 Tax=Periconia digitata TaxID=1303443 RepID=A0A9W4ULC9_9PLEO|nr:unnamed protein product [Periconia digitata]
MTVPHPMEDFIDFLIVFVFDSPHPPSCRESRDNRDYGCVVRRDIGAYSLLAHQVRLQEPM